MRASLMSYSFRKSVKPPRTGKAPASESGGHRGSGHDALAHTVLYPMKARRLPRPDRSTRPPVGNCRWEVDSAYGPCRACFHASRRSLKSVTGRSYDKLSSMTTPPPNHDHHTFEDPAAVQARDIAEVPAVEVITTTAVHLMSAAAVKCGLADGPDAAELKDLDEARKLITALAGLITAGAPEIGSQHAAPLRDGLRSLQLAFREASLIPDAPGKGPGEKFTGPVN